MSFLRCETCDKQFATKQGLTYHVNRKVCLKINKKICPLCGKMFANYKMCEYHQINQVCSKYNQKSEDSVPKKVKCQLKQSLCDYANYTKEQLILELVETKAEVRTLKENPTIINNSVNIVVPPDLSKTDNYDQIQRNLPTLMHDALSKHPGNFITYMIKETNCNPERPIYNSVKITNKKDNYAQVSNGSKYVHVTKKKIISQLIDNKRGILQEYVDNNGDKYGAKILNRYQRYVDALDDDKKIMKDLENDIICMLLDVSEVIGDEEWSKRLLNDLKSWKNDDDHSNTGSPDILTSS